jgi:hypothetical protein
MWAWSLIFAFEYNKAVLVGMGCIISQVQEGSTTVHHVSVEESHDVFRQAVLAGAGVQMFAEAAL